MLEAGIPSSTPLGPPGGVSRERGGFILVLSPVLRREVLPHDELGPGADALGRGGGVFDEVVKVDVKVGVKVGVLSARAPRFLSLIHI